MTLERKGKNKRRSFKNSIWSYVSFGIFPQQAQSFQEGSIGQLCYWHGYVELGSKEMTCGIGILMAKIRLMNYLFDCFPRLFLCNNNDSLISFVWYCWLVNYFCVEIKPVFSNQQKMTSVYCIHTESLIYHLYSHI